MIFHDIDKFSSLRLRRTQPPVIPSATQAINLVAVKKATLRGRTAGENRIELLQH